MQMVEDVEMAAAVDEQRWDDGVGRAGGGGCLLTYKKPQSSRELSQRAVWRSAEPHA